MSFEAVLEAFLRATADVHGEDPRLDELRSQIVQSSKRLPPGDLDVALHELLNAANAPHPRVSGVVALLCGCLVEEGATPELLVTRLIPRVEEALTPATRALEVLSGLPEVDATDDAASTCTVGDRIVSAREWQAFVDEDPTAAHSLLAIDPLCRALIAGLTRWPAALKSGSAQALASRLDPFSHAAQFAFFLARLLRVPMNEEWYILDPKGRRGFALQVSGVANAFQVYALVHAALCHVPRSLTHWSPPVPPPPPNEATLAVANGSGPQEAAGSYTPPFTLFRWTAITKPKHIPGFNDYLDWFSNSAVPAELARFGENRIGVLGDGAIRMEFGLAREFAALRASVALTRHLERRQVVDLFHAFSSGPHPGRPLPGIGWP
jgi:hypothetical protein